MAITKREIAKKLKNMRDERFVAEANAAREKKRAAIQAKLDAIGFRELCETTDRFFTEITPAWKEAVRAIAGSDGAEWPYPSVGFHILKIASRNRGTYESTLDDMAYVMPHMFQFSSDIIEIGDDANETWLAISDGYKELLNGVSACKGVAATLKYLEEQGVDVSLFQPDDENERPAEPDAKPKVNVSLLGLKKEGK